MKTLLNEAIKDLFTYGLPFALNYFLTHYSALAALSVGWLLTQLVAFLKQKYGLTTPPVIGHYFE